MDRSAAEHLSEGAQLLTLADRRNAAPCLSAGLSSWLSLAAASAFGWSSVGTESGPSWTSATPSLAPALARASDSTCPGSAEFDGAGTDAAGSFLADSCLAGSDPGSIGLTVAPPPRTANIWRTLGGWAACIQHIVLRLLLWRIGAIPRDYVAFLDYAAERILLRKVGGGYIFVHRLLLEYFASLETEVA